MMVCIVLALAGTELWTVVRAQTVGFVVDASDSTRPLATEMATWVTSALKERRPDDEASVIVFGQQAAVDVPSTVTPSWQKVESVINSNRTDVESALRLAQAMLPQQKRRRVVLLSDGRQNNGDAVSAARALQESGIRLDVLPVDPARGRDVVVSSLEAPATVNEGERFDLALRLDSSFAGRGMLRVFRDGSVVCESEVSFQAGESLYLLKVNSGTPGLRSFRAVIESAGDTSGSNNEATCLVSVSGRPRALVIAADPASARNLSAALEAAGVEVSVMGPEMAPRSAEGWARYSFVVIAEVPAESLENKSMESLETAVRDLGRGLVMVGGEDSFGPGGYFRTPVERALPVFMDIRGRGEIPSLGLVLVIDKSGSMSETSAGISKVELAKEAAIRSTEVCSPKDVIGVVAFDGEAKWVVKPTTIADSSKVQEDIGTIRAGGGTNIYPALDEAYKALKERETKYKHVILLTDGMSAYGGDYGALLKDMRAAGITVSTVAVGNDADRQLLEHIAKLGEGRYYFSNDSSGIPKIFTKETILASRNYVVEGNFLPRASWPSSLIKGLDTVPRLGGYIATTAKQTAETVLESPSGEPVLAAWQYGLGRALAWTSDTRGRWTRGWLESGDFATLWTNIAGWVAQPETLQGFETTLTVRGDSTELSVDTGVSGITGVSARIVGPDGKATDVTAEPVAPGQFRANFPSTRPGAYIAQITPQSAQGSAGTVLAGVSVPYSPEYRVTGADRAFLEQLAAAGGGKVLSSPAEAYARDLAPTFATSSLVPYLLALACMLLPLEIAARKLYIGHQDIERVREAAGSLWPSKAPQERDVSLSRLLSRREQISKGLDSKGLGSPRAAAGPTAGPAASSAAGPVPGRRAPGAEPVPSSPEPSPAIGAEAIDTSRLLARKRNREKSQNPSNDR